MKKIFGTDYSKINEFKRIGYTYTKIAENENYLVWEMFKDGITYKNYEVWKKVWKKQPDDTLYLKCPGDEEFGRTAWYFCGTKQRCAEQILERYKISIL